MAAAGNLGISEEAIEALQNHLQDLEFVDDFFKLKGCCCSACRKLAIGHRIANCGDVFCNKCYFEHYMKRCPYCREIVQASQQVQGFERALFDFHVKCKFKKNGCEQIVELKNFLNHIHMCTFSTENLLPKLNKENPNFDAIQQLKGDVNNTKKIMKKVQEENGRICHEFLEIKDALRNFVDVQADTLKKLTDELCNKDTTDVMQASITQLKEVRMKSEEAGKGLIATALQNKEATELMQSEIIHLQNALKKSDEIAKDFLAKHGETHKIETHQRKQLEELESKLKTQFRKELNESLCLYQGDAVSSWPVVIPWKVTGIQEKLSILMTNTSLDISNEDYYDISDELQFKPILWTYPETKWVSIRVKFNPDLKDRANISMPYLHSRKYILLDQSDASEKLNIELIDRPNFGRNSSLEIMAPHFNQSCFFPVCFLKGENRYLKNDQILIKIIFQPIYFLYNSAASSDGTLLWRINNYSKKKQDEIDRVKCRLISEPFRTSEMGYLLQVEVYLNGCGLSATGKFLSIFSRVILGENDADLPCRFMYKCSLYVLDQSESSPKIDISQFHNSIQAGKSNPVWGFHQFALQSQVEDKKYLKGDSLLIKVMTEVL